MRLDDTREIKYTPAIAVIRPINFSDYVPLDCPLCGLMLKDHVDVLSYDKLECCDPCAMTWAQPNREKWDKGWRPPAEKIRLLYDSRKKLPTYVVR